MTAFFRSTQHRLYAKSLLVVASILFGCFPLFGSPVSTGADQILSAPYVEWVRGKKIGLITNHTGINQTCVSTAEELSKVAHLEALFSPEHGLKGATYADRHIGHDQKPHSDAKENHKPILVYSLHGEVKRPTTAMLKDLDLLVYDIQEIGSRSYTYISTLFYAIEEAAKHHLPLLVLDRPNPMGGMTVDGPMLEETLRSFLGYIDIPYCHGMTVGELALFFNAEYKIGCELRVVPLKGWKRTMTYQETGLPWVPTSPYIPEPDSPFYYASTGILGALGVVSIGIGYTLPFKVIGAPWICADTFAKALNSQHLEGVTFLPFHFRPFYGKFKDQDCSGVKILITNPLTYRPLAVQYMLIGLLKSLYPSEFEQKLKTLTKVDKQSLCKINGSQEILRIIEQDKFIAWKLIDFDKDKRAAFMKKRSKYLLYE